MQYPVLFHTRQTSISISYPVKAMPQLRQLTAGFLLERSGCEFFIIFFNLNIRGWSPYWVHSALRPLLAYCTCPGVIVRLEKLVEWAVLQGKQKYPEKACPDAILSTTNPTCHTRAPAAGNQRLTASAMVRPKRSRLVQGFVVDKRHWAVFSSSTQVFSEYSGFIYQFSFHQLFHIYYRPIIIDTA
jgi:hypothetical protein